MNEPTNTSEGQPYFVSYSRIDGNDFAAKLAAELATANPTIVLWVDKDGIKEGFAWPAEIENALRTCPAVLFAMTTDSVGTSSFCSKELILAQSYKKPIVPLQVLSGVPPCLLLCDRQFVDFSNNFEQGVTRLREHLNWLDTPSGRLKLVEYRLTDAKRGIPASGTDRERRLSEIKTLEEDIAELQLVISDPKAAAQRTQQAINDALERERTAVPPPPAVSRCLSINPIPSLPSYFQDRYVETGLLAKFLSNDGLRIATVVGRGGTGKTALVCRLLNAVEGGVLPDTGGAIEADGIVYLSESGTHRVNASNIFSDLLRLLPDTDKTRLEGYAKNAQVGPRERMLALLESSGTRRHILLLDNLEDLLDQNTFQLKDSALSDTLAAILDAPAHGLKVIITTRVAAPDLARRQPGRQQLLELDEGLPSPYAENVLRAMDESGQLGLRDAPDALLAQARLRTRGYPRALEALKAILAADRSARLEDLVGPAAAELPEDVVGALVGEAFSRLDVISQQVMEALAVFARPVPDAAVDYLLQPFLTAIKSKPILNRLVNMQFVRLQRDTGRYSTHPVDRGYALARVTTGHPDDRLLTPLPFTRYALLNRAAEYFAASAKPTQECATLADLQPRLAEFDMRCKGEDFHGAAQAFFDFSWLLNQWSYFREVDTLSSALLGKVSDPRYAGWILHTNAWAKFSLGDIKAARTNFQTILDLTKESNAFEGAVELKSWALIGIAEAHTEAGQTTQAIDILQALVAGLEGNKEIEESALLSLARCYTHLGQTRLGLQCNLRAMELAQATNNRYDQCTLLNNIANSRGRLGEFATGLDFAEQGVHAAEALHSRQLEVCNITNAGMLLMDLDKVDDATTRLRKAAEIADEIANLQFQDEARQPLAIAWMLKGDFKQARDVAEVALRYAAPQQNQPRSGLLALLGIIALRQGDREAAQRYFKTGLSEADAMLATNPQHFVVLESKGLVHSGLALCEGLQPHIDEAINAFKRARALTCDNGIVLRVTRLFDLLAQADTASPLATVRPSVLAP